MERIRLLLHSLLCVAGIFTLAAVGMAALSVRTAARHADGFLTSRGVEGLPMTIRHVNQILKETGETLVVVNKASTAQKTYWDANTKKISKLLDNANGAVSDLRVVEGQLAQTVKDSNNQINARLLPQATQDLAALQVDIESIKPMIAVIQNQADNPDIAATLRELKMATGNMNNTTGDIYAMVDAYKRNLEKPKNLAWKIFSALTGIGAKAGQISTLAK